MKILHKLLIPLLLLAVVFALASCGEDAKQPVNIVTATVEAGELVFNMSDGSTVRAGKLPDNAEGIRLAGAVIDDGELILSFSDGISKNCGDLPDFTLDYVLRAASITEDGYLVLHTNTGKVDLGRVLYLSAPSQPLTPSGASEYAEGRDLTGRNTATVEIVVKGYGTVTVLLDATTAPITVENFLTLVRSGFYNGLTFHRVMSDFMIQGGDPKADGSGNSSNIIYGEFASNGYTGNDLSHKRGVISMARRSYPNDSASCQFFICNADASNSLDGSYAAFGYVTNGMNIIDAITEYTTPFSDSETGVIANKEKQAVIEQIRIVDDLAITTVHSAKLDESGALILTLSNGAVLNPVAIPTNPENLAFKGVSVSGSRLSIDISDGFLVKSGIFPVIFGSTDGAVISINDNGQLVISIADAEYNLGKVFYPTVPSEELVPEGASEYADTRDLEGRNYAIVEIKFRGYGTVTVLLDATAAPKTVANFLSLVESGYYNGVSIHAVISDIMLETGMGENMDSLEPIFGEFASNGYTGNDLSHKRGVLSMAINDKPDTATSVFFFCATDLSKYFDGESAAFGYVINGMNIVDKVIELTSPYSNSSTGVIGYEEKRAVIESITITRELDTPTTDTPAGGEDDGNGGSLDDPNVDDDGWSQM